MRKLLSANFTRLWRSKELWLCAVGMLIISILSVCSSANFMKLRGTVGFDGTLDSYYFQLAPYIAAFIGLFISLFIGTEHSDGTLRNKIIVGHTRTNIFLSNFIVCFVGSLAIVVAWLIGGLVGLYLIGPFEMVFSEFTLHILIVMGIIASYTALFVWASSVSTNKAFTVVLVIILYVATALAGNGVIHRLSEPEFNSGVTYIKGEFVDLGESPNPLYLSGNIRIAAEWLRDLMPMGQAITMAQSGGSNIEHPVRSIIAAVMSTVLINALGVVSFRKKALR